MVEGFVIFFRWMYSDGVLNGDKDYWAVWSYLMFNVNYSDTRIILRNEVLTVHKDEIFTTRKRISDATKVSETKVDKALKLFEKVGYIKMKSDRRGRLISLTFEKLQTKPHTTPSQENVNYCTDAVQPTDNQECCNSDNEIPHNNATSERSETKVEPQKNQSETKVEPQKSQTAHTKEIKEIKEIKKQRNKMNKDILSGKPDGTNESEIIRQVIDYLNRMCSTHYKSTSAETRRLVKARIAQGFTLDDFVKVIDNKTADWLHDTEMSKYLRPSTLFGAKFESYLNQPLTPKNVELKNLVEDVRKKLEAKKAIRKINSVV